MMKVLLTGATGTMGQACLEELLDLNDIQLQLIVRPTNKNRKLLRPYQSRRNVTMIWGDLTDAKLIDRIVPGVDLIIHAGALVSPNADSQPEKTLKTNYGSTLNFLQAIEKQHLERKIKFVYISSVAVIGDRQPPFHWGRVGDPVLPSVFDYYALSKAASERAVIESRLDKWVILRMSGILSSKMAQIQDPIIFHNPLNNVLEYVALPDVALMVSHLVAKVNNQSLPENFYGHLYNVGGNKKCRIATWELYQKIYGDILGFKNLNRLIDPHLYATRNFHGHFYLDSDRLNEILDFQYHTLDYFYEVFKKSLGWKYYLVKGMNHLPGLAWLLSNGFKRHFAKLAKKEGGPLNLKFRQSGRYEIYYGLKDIPKSYASFPFYHEYEKIRRLDHGYDPAKAPNQLGLEDVRQAALFRGGACLSTRMTRGDWQTPLVFRCAQNHQFSASPKLILEGGYWCNECEKTSWDYWALRLTNPFWGQLALPGDGKIFPPMAKEVIWEAQLEAPKE